MHNKIIDVLVTIVLIVLVLVTGGMSLYLRHSNDVGKKEYEQVRTKAVVVVSENVQKNTNHAGTKKDAKSYPELEIDFEALKEENPDFRGWLYFPLLDISYPIVQSEDNNHYLHYSFSGEKTSAGCIFMDCGATSDWSDRNTFVFGHNMKDGSMFGSFDKLVKGEVNIKDDPYFYIYTEEGVRVYEIFSLYETDSSSDRYMTFTSDAAYDEYTVWAKVYSIFESDCNLNRREDLVSISTCYGAAGTKNRVLLHGALKEKASYQDAFFKGCLSCKKYIIKYKII